MINFIKRLFDFRRYPKKGSKWGVTDGSPWPIPNKVLITIIDAKEGWVRYYIGHEDSFFNDQRLKLNEFLESFTEIK